MYDLPQWPTLVQAGAALVQAGTAIIIVILTARLVRATNTYAALTKTSVDLAKKQYEGDTSPMWFLSLRQSSNHPETIRLTVKNLSKMSAIITHVLLRVDSEENSEARSFVLNFGLSGLDDDVHDIGAHIRETLNPYVVGGEWKGVVKVEIVASVGHPAIQIPSPSFRFAIVIRDEQVLSVKPKVPGIAIEQQSDGGAQR